jgi:hypothetical protein
VGTGIPYKFAEGPYDIWRAEHFTAAELADAAVSGDAADPDGDGIPNLVEFAFNLDPRVTSHPNLPRAFLQDVSGQDRLQIQYTQRNAPAGVKYALQTSSDLFSWNTDVTNFTQVSTADNGDGTSLVTMQLQSSITNSPQMFLRVGIQK